jgi:hypothetical protein
LEQRWSAYMGETLHGTKRRGSHDRRQNIFGAFYHPVLIQ